ncbi:MAG: ATP-binding protein [Spirochaetales bacterium]|nr:ATP-binding protein [Spirochaetales bacterium]
MKRELVKKNNFYLHLAHELKTNLTLIDVILHQYIKIIKNKMTPEIKDLQYILHIMSGDMTNLLDAEKIEWGSFLYQHHQILNVSVAMSRVIKSFQGIALKKNICLQYTSAGLFFIYMDPGAFIRIINNILDNSIQFTEEHGHIDVFLKEENSRIMITIQDDGPGMSKEDLGTIYMPCYEKWEKRRTIGNLGTGLFIVKQIIDSVNGEINIQNRPDKGLIVTLIFPQGDKPQKIDEQVFFTAIPMILPGKIVVHEEKYNKEKPVIFIVEAHKKLRHYLHFCMRNDFNIFSAADEVSALEKLMVIPKPDIIIVHTMEDAIQNAWIYGNLSRHNIYKDIPVFILTNRWTREERLEILNKGVIDVIRIPFCVEELVLKVRSFLTNRESFKKTCLLTMETKISEFLRKEGDDDFLIFEKKCIMYRISPREKIIVREILKGLQNKEIADNLFLSPHTVKKHIRSIFMKCEVQNRVELVNCFKR